MMDFSIITGIAEPMMKVFTEKCCNWVPKILKKMELESVGRCKTFQTYFTTLAEFESGTAEKILERKQSYNTQLQLQCNFKMYITDPDAAVILSVIQKLLDKRAKNSEKFLTNHT